MSSAALFHALMIAVGVSVIPPLGRPRGTRRVPSAFFAASKRVLGISDHWADVAGETATDIEKPQASTAPMTIRMRRDPPAERARHQCRNGGPASATTLASGIPYSD